MNKYDCNSYDLHFNIDNIYKIIDYMLIIALF